MSEPAIPTVCWPVDWSCTPLNPTDPDLDDRAVAMAASWATTSLRTLTGFQVGGCPVTVRPCAASCFPSARWSAFGGGWMTPHISRSGAWVNACGCRTDCSCGSLSEVILPGPVGYVSEVEVDGVLLPETAYRVDNGNRLVRLDGDLWPTCQDMEAAPGDPGTFTVTYLQGLRVDALAAAAAGRLAWEFYQACLGETCNLPTNVVAMTRQGVSFELAAGAFPNNATGVPLVDAWLRQVNPYAVTVKSHISSPDRRRARVTTWRPL